MKKKFKLINGWTKETVLAQVKKYNNGTKAYEPCMCRCVYKEENGNRCAVGCFIPDDNEALGVLAPAFEIVDQYKLHEFMPFAGCALEEFQNAHDRSDSDNVYENIENFLNERVE